MQKSQREREKGRERDSLICKTIRPNKVYSLRNIAFSVTSGTNTEIYIIDIIFIDKPSDVSTVN